MIALPAASSGFRIGDLFGRQPGLFFVCLAVWTVSNMDQALFGYAIPGILAEFGLPLSAIGLILTISFVVSAALVILAGVAADRWGRGIVTVTLLVSSATAVAAQGIAGGVVMLTLFRAMGFGISGGLSPTTNAIVIGNAVPRFRGLSAGMLQCGYPLGWLLASLFAAPLLDHFGWRSICFGALIVVPLALPITWALRRYGVFNNPRSRTADEIPAIAISPRMLFTPAYCRSSVVLIAVFLMFGGAYAGSAFFFTAFFTQYRGYSAGDAAALVGMSNGIAVAGYLAAALIGEFVLSRRNVFVIWCLSGALALAGLLWWATGRTQDLLWYGAMAAFFFGSQAVIIVLLADLYPASMRATAIAVCGSAPLSIGFAIFPLVVPVAVAHLGWPGGLSIVVIPLLTGVAGAALMLPNPASSRSRHVAQRRS